MESLKLDFNWGTRTSLDTGRSDLFLVSEFANRVGDRGGSNFLGGLVQLPILLVA